MMKRRRFLKNMSMAGAATAFAVNGMPFRTMAKTSMLQQLAANSQNDKVLVLIQLHGGNDGLNTTIPIDQYDQYYALRPNIAIPNTGNRKYIQLDSYLPSNQQLGLHPDMLAMKAMYDEGRAAVIQNVAYDNINGSHFRSRDIWFMGGDYDDEFASGWLGRYLDHTYPGYPDDYPSEDMPDPLALEIGNDMSLAFHRNNGIPVSIAINNPQQFYNLVTTVGIEPPEEIADSYYGQELEWIIDLEEMSNVYAERLRDVYEKGQNSPTVTYPEIYPFSAGGSLRNPLTGQLRMISRLLDGGVKTKVFLARMGGFDTHANQVEEFDTTMGAHAAKMYHLSSAVKAFHDDLEAMGLGDKVLTMTFSEFGRRALSNGSYGTDHGRAAPMLVFGKGVNAGIFGENPDLSNLTGGNLRHDFDYRQVFTAVLQDWWEASPDAILAAKFEDYSATRLPIITGNDSITSREEFISSRYRLEDCYPNPALNYTMMKYRINSSTYVKLKIISMKGETMRTIVEQHQAPGEYQYKVDLYGLPAGIYLYQLEASNMKAVKRLVKV